jgi:Ca2+-binding EF-hand superfamily protein
MTELTQSEFVDLMVPKISSLNDMKGCNYSANEIAETIFRVAAKKRIDEKERDKAHRRQFDALGLPQIRFIVGFFVMDLDKSGFIKKDDLKEIIKRVEPEKNFNSKNSLNEFTEYLFNKLDLNSDGLLSIEEHISHSVEDDLEVTDELLDELKLSAEKSVKIGSDKCSIV